MFAVNPFSDNRAYSFAIQTHRRLEWTLRQTWIDMGCGYPVVKKNIFLSSLFSVLSSWAIFSFRRKHHQICVVSCRLLKIQNHTHNSYEPKKRRPMTTFSKSFLRKNIEPSARLLLLHWPFNSEARNFACWGFKTFAWFSQCLLINQQHKELHSTNQERELSFQNCLSY